MTVRPGHLYVVELRPGVCKVGRSSHRFDRLAAYATRDTELLAWSSPAFARFPAVPGTRETFAVDFRWAVGVARSMVRAVTLDNAFAA